MSVDMAVWEGDRPQSDEDAGQTFKALYDKYVGREYPIDPTPKIKEFVEALTATFPDLDSLSDDEVDDSPWADSPLLGNASGPFIYFSMVASDAAIPAWDPCYPDSYSPWPCCLRSTGRRSRLTERSQAVVRQRTALGPVFRKTLRAERGGDVVLAALVLVGEASEAPEVLGMKGDLDALARCQVAQA